MDPWEENYGHKADWEPAGLISTGVIQGMYQMVALGTQKKGQISSDFFLFMKCECF